MNKANSAQSMIDRILEKMLVSKTDSNHVVNFNNKDIRDVIIKSKNKRKKYGITQIQLSENIGCTRQTIAAIESGKSIPKYDTLLKIAKALNIKIEMQIGITAKDK